jgi:hypothetical protein
MIHTLITEVTMRCGTLDTSSLLREFLEQAIKICLHEASGFTKQYHVLQSVHKCEGKEIILFSVRDTVAMSSWPIHREYPREPCQSLPAEAAWDCANRAVTEKDS